MTTQNTKKGTYQDFCDKLARLDMLDGLTQAQLCRMAHDAGFETPAAHSTDIVAYKAKNAKTPTLYADCKAMINGRSDVKVGFTRFSNLLLDAQKARVHAEALDSLVSQIREGNVDLPKGWAVTDETETGFSVAQLKTA